MTNTFLYHEYIHNIQILELKRKVRNIEKRHFDCLLKIVVNTDYLGEYRIHDNIILGDHSGL